MIKNKIHIGLIGLGYWGPNILRVLLENNFVKLVSLFDIDIPKANDLSAKYSQTRVVLSLDKLLQDPSIDAIIIATPVSTHIALITEALKNSKHVFCEKPMSLNSREISIVKTLLKRTNKILMIGHIFEFNPVIRYIQKEIRAGELGKLYYLDFIRNGLGPIRGDVSVIADLASHDISIANFLLEDSPISVCANATSFFNNSREDIASITIEYPQKIIVNIHVSWLDPIKQRQVKIVSEKKMFLFDDVSVSEKLKIIQVDKTYIDNTGNFASFQHKVKSGEVSIPNIEYKEPLAEEMAHFIECVSLGKKPLTDIESALRVTILLEAISESVNNGSKKILL